MFLPNLVLLLAFCICKPFIHTAAAIPVNLLGQDLVHANLSTVHPIVVHENDPHLTLNSRPHLNKIYPVLNKGDHYARFRKYGKDIPSDSDAASVFYMAAHEVDDWISVARKHTYTPIEREYSWRSGSIELTVGPTTNGYLLGDLKYYLPLMTAFHTKYDAFWEWEGQLIDNSGTFGFLRVVGKATHSVGIL
ncbi:MAG: hypothetical protein Q9208_007069 [Pyrenodesmia sp. 3 TL-2023]